MATRLAPRRVLGAWNGGVVRSPTAAGAAGAAKALSPLGSGAAAAVTQAAAVSDWDDVPASAELRRWLALKDVLVRLQAIARGSLARRHAAALAAACEAWDAARTPLAHRADAVAECGEPSVASRARLRAEAAAPPRGADEAVGEERRRLLAAMRALPARDKAAAVRAARVPADGTYRKRRVAAAAFATAECPPRASAKLVAGLLAKAPAKGLRTSCFGPQL